MFRLTDLGGSFRLVVIGTAPRPARGIETAAVALRTTSGELVTTGFPANRVPHVTVATNDRTPARESNAVLGEGYEPVTDGPELVAKLQTVSVPATGSRRAHPGMDRRHTSARM